VASRLIVDTVLDSFQQANAFDAAALGRCLADAERMVRMTRHQHPELAEMSGTVAALVIDPMGERALWGHLGDTRICHFRRGRLVSMTRDHSVVQRLIDAGLATGARPLVARNLLYGAIGGAEETPPTLVDGAVRVEDGDAFLVCTDGFWSAVDLHQMQRSLRLARTPEDWIGDLHRRVSAVEDSDNYTAVAVWIGAPEEITVIDAEVD
jgi:serine/threonine protein phosphatase PrpC